MSRNLLDQETSPYLLQHRDNPVHWRAWNAETLAEAKREEKPILLSIGYAACHWCHVMAHESFEDQDTADLINRLFIPIKVDREERPDLDIIYQSALASLGIQGGWPLTMFLSPAAEPFWGGTYFPPTARFGRPSFKDLLAGVAAAFEHEPEKIVANIEALRLALTGLNQPTAGSAPASSLLDQAAEALHAAIDPVHGGLAGAPKFPQVPLLQLLWRGALRTGNKTFEDAVLLSLDHMCQGGIFDHLGGGFARYATDETWLVPHFEKMLYDNAALIDLLTAAWQKTRSPLYARRVFETVSWIKREMMTEGGAFAASLDADSDGGEGRFYVWQASEIDRLLPPPLRTLFKNTYAVTESGNWDGVNILHRNHPNGLPGEDCEPDLTHARGILLSARQQRPKPNRDDKVLADWNAMMIAALAKASQVFAQSEWLTLAEGAYRAIGKDADGDRLAHSSRCGRRQDEAMLDDYAEMAKAALALYQATGEADYLAAAERWASLLDRHYWDAVNGGYFFTADDATGLILRTKSANDLSTPSGNGVMMEVLAGLFHLTGKDAYRARAECLMQSFGGHLERGFPALSTLLCGWDLLENAIEAVLIGEPGDLAYEGLLAVLSDAPQPNLLLSRFPAARPLPISHPAADKHRIHGGEAVVYLCRNQTCSAPLTTGQDLRAVLGPLDAD